ncbi:MAG: ABC transporter permease [Lachnospiraceae bacterium]|nr:ABC transporter permease [Lachnospiraceae bacterium]
MKSKRILLSVLAALFSFVILFLLNILPGFSVKLRVVYEQEEDCQIFWGDDIGTLSEEDSLTDTFSADELHEKIKGWSSEDSIIRIDFGMTEQTVYLEKISLQNRFAEVDIPITEDTICLFNDITMETLKDGGYEFTVTGEDPYIGLDLSDSIREIRLASQMKMRIVYALAAVLVGALIFWQYRRICILILWAKDIFDSRGLIMDLAVTDFRTKYASSYLGAVWAFVQPIVTVLIYVMVFGFGLKSSAVDGYEFPIWLTAGIIPWFYFQDGINMATTSLLEYSYLVKKMVFQVKILPVVKVMAALLIHLAFIVLAVIIHGGYGVYPDLYYLQLIYYCFCTTVLALGIGYLTAALNVFFTDLQQIINIILQFGIWLTPIMWNISILGEKVEHILWFNPMYYVVSGYRDCFYNKVLFWEKPAQTLYFWVLSICFLMLGTYVFKKLERHFADVL